MQDNYGDYENYLKSLIPLNNSSKDKNYEHMLDLMDNIASNKFGDSSASWKTKLYTDVELLASKVSKMTITNYMCYDALNIATSYKHLRDDPEAQQYFDILANCIIYMANGTCALEWVREIGTHLVEMAALIISIRDTSYIMEWTIIRDEYFIVMETAFLQLAELDDLVDWVLAHNNNIDKCQRAKKRIILYYSDYFDPDTSHNGIRNKCYRGLWRSDLYRNMPGEYDLGVLL